MEDPLVSISCITYNHGDYIAETIEGFLMQKTGFSFEILIHDDASTDETVKIIKRYEKEYPGIVRPIYQKENKYSKGISRIDTRYNWSRAKGKYVATCEGDDYWTDRDKLQKQVEFMEKHTGCVYCCHATQCINELGDLLNCIIKPWNVKTFFNTDEIIYEKYGPICQTSSVMFVKSIIDCLPGYFFSAPQGDYAFRIYSSTQGSVGYIDEVMSVYRRFSTGSWSESLKNSSEKSKWFYHETIKLLQDIDSHTGGQYSIPVQMQILKLRKGLLSIEKDITCLNDRHNREIFSSFTAKEKFKQYFRWFAPALYKNLVLIRDRFKKLI